LHALEERKARSIVDTESKPDEVQAVESKKVSASQTESKPDEVQAVESKSSSKKVSASQTESKPDEVQTISASQAQKVSAVESKSKPEEVQVDDIDPGLLAYTCCYIACKYFLDETTPCLRILFPKTTCYEDSQIIQMEKTILMELVEWATYRSTVYDILDKKTQPATLFAILKMKPAVYGHAFTKLAEQFSKLAQTQ
jgi:hypothetical protein